MACGLCCTGHLFARAQLKPAEVENARGINLTVIASSSEPSIDFSLPCPHWQDKCRIYNHPHKPAVCSAFECKLLKQLNAGQVTLERALGIVKNARQLAAELETILPSGPRSSFRLLLFAYIKNIEQTQITDAIANTVRVKGGALLIMYEQYFGVTGLFNRPDESTTRP